MLSITKAQEWRKSDLRFSHFSRCLGVGLYAYHSSTKYNKYKYSSFPYLKWLTGAFGRIKGIMFLKHFTIFIYLKNTNYLPFMICILTRRVTI